MKVVFCIDDNPQYLLMLLVAVRSLRALHGDDAPCLCVYAGDDPTILAALEKEHIPVARYAPVLDRATIPQEFHRCIGAFLKLELALVPELAADDMVLYCDVDVLCVRPLDALFAERPQYMAMARENTAPFFHEHAAMDYTWRGRSYVVPLPFPIWTYSSGVVVFNLARLRKHDHIHNFLAYCAQNVHRIGNLDQSLLNYFFGKRIAKLDPRWNRPPYFADAADRAHIVHFHGPKPWQGGMPLWRELAINHFWNFREQWLAYLDAAERERVMAWEEAASGE